MTRPDGEAVLLSLGWHAEELATMSDALLDWIATGLDERRYGFQGPGVFGQPFGSSGPKTRTGIPDPDDPTVEEIARAANVGDALGLPLKHRAAAATARAANRAALEAEGRAISQNPAHSAATLRALANIVRVGTGR